MNVEEASSFKIHRYNAGAAYLWSEAVSGLVSGPSAELATGLPASPTRTEATTRSLIALFSVYRITTSTTAELARAKG